MSAAIQDLYDVGADVVAARAAGPPPARGAPRAA
jgi:hypothetical protein